MRMGEGVIEEIKDNGLAKIKVSSDYLYVACSACAAAEHVFVTAYNTIGAKEGQTVRYEVEDQHLASSAFVCFIVPLIAAILAGFIGYEAGLAAGYDSVYFGAAGAAAGLLISAGIVRKYDTALGKIMDSKANITEIIDEEGPAGE
jgi:sigma-E factor negative regulatory protein RseC